MMAYNSSAWARACNDGHKYICDAIGHGVVTPSGRRCLELANTTLAMAQRAVNPGNAHELVWTNELLKSLSALKIEAGIK